MIHVHRTDFFALAANVKNDKTRLHVNSQQHKGLHGGWRDFCVQKDLSRAFTYFDILF